MLARFNDSSSGKSSLSWASALHECLANKSVLILLGSLVAGMVTTASGAKALQPFVSQLFPGMLCFFLLDLGLVAARRIADLRASGFFSILFALAFPLVSGGAALAIASVCHFREGDAFLSRSSVRADPISLCQRLSGRRCPLRIPVSMWGSRWA
jgi:hypothetical protein